jgi:hypothetical protein
MKLSSFESLPSCVFGEVLGSVRLTEETCSSSGTMAVPGIGVRLPRGVSFAGASSSSVVSNEFFAALSPAFSSVFSSAFSSIFPSVFSIHLVSFSAFVDAPP